MVNPVVDHVWANMHAKIADRGNSECIANDGERNDKKDKKPPLPFRIEK